jgi:hypothetical protein
MTRRDLLDDHMDQFGTQLSGAASGRTPRRSPVKRQWVRPAIGVGGLAALGAGVAAVTLFPVAGGKVDVVSEAKAALADPGGIVHLVITQSVGWVDGGPGKPVSAKNRHEAMRANACFDPSNPVSLWIATTGPSRYRVSYVNSPCTAQTAFRQVIQPGTLEESGYSDGAYRRYFPAQDLLLRTTDLSEERDKGRIEFSPQQLGLQDGGDGETEAFRDPLDRVRQLLAAGQLRDAGKFRGKDGRELWRLRGTVPQTTDYRSADGKGGYKVKITAEYTVDAKTYAPVSFNTISRAYPGGKAGWAQGHSINFERYERLPLNAENEKLVTVTGGPDTKTITLTSKEEGRSYRLPVEDKAALKAAQAVAKENQQEAEAIVEGQIRAEERAAERTTTP